MKNRRERVFAEEAIAFSISHYFHEVFALPASVRMDAGKLNMMNMFGKETQLRCM